jgi:hypothetical protein
MSRNHFRCGVAGIPASSHQSVPLFIEIPEPRVDHFYVMSIVKQ